MAGERKVICPSDSTECFLDEVPNEFDNQIGSGRSDGLMLGQDDYLIPLSSTNVTKKKNKRKSTKPRKITGKGLKSIRKKKPSNKKGPKKSLKKKIKKSYKKARKSKSKK